MLMLAYVDKENKTIGGDPKNYVSRGFLMVEPSSSGAKKKWPNNSYLCSSANRSSLASRGKLYRWGFRQVSVVQQSNTSRRDMIFGHEFFQRDNKAMMSRMRSVTAAGTRRAVQARTAKQVGQRTETLAIEPKSALVDQQLASTGGPPTVLPTPSWCRETSSGQRTWAMVRVC